MIFLLLTQYFNFYYDFVQEKGDIMANLHFHYGVMGASKSAKLITTAHDFERTGNKYEVIKPLRDNRDSVDHVVSRLGISVPATALKNLAHYKPKSDTQFLLIDEVQFFSAADIDRLVKIADEHDIVVMCYGLMADSNEHLFPASKRLVEVGAKLHLLEAVCQYDGCKKLATHNARFDENGKLIVRGPRIKVGALQYQSLCRPHFNMYKKIAQQKEK